LSTVVAAHDRLPLTVFLDANATTTGALNFRSGPAQETPSPPPEPTEETLICEQVIEVAPNMKELYVVMVCSNVLRNIRCSISNS
jgi:hypothetical protein